MNNEIKICNNNHGQILYSTSTYTYCPLCALTQHNNEVHDFIKSHGYIPELLEYQAKMRAIREVSDDS